MPEAPPLPGNAELDMFCPEQAAMESDAASASSTPRSVYFIEVLRAKRN
jgi:hypothetical protein